MSSEIFVINKKGYITEFWIREHRIIVDPPIKVREGEIIQIIREAVPRIEIVQPDGTFMSAYPAGQDESG